MELPIFGRQNGASDEVLKELEEGMENYAEFFVNAFNKDCTKLAGAEAAGDMEVALTFFAMLSCSLGQIPFWIY